MTNSVKIVATICLTLAAAVAIPPMLSTLGAGRAQPARVSVVKLAQPDVWDFQPLTAGMSAAVRAAKNHA